MIEVIIANVPGNPDIVKEKVNSSPQVVPVRFDGIVSAKAFVEPHERSTTSFPDYFDKFWFNFNQSQADRNEFNRNFRHLYKIKRAILEKTSIDEKAVVVRKNDKKIFIVDGHNLRLFCFATFKSHIEWDPQVHRSVKDHAQFSLGYGCRREDRCVSPSSADDGDRGSGYRISRLSQHECEYRDSCTILSKNGRINSEARLITLLSELFVISWDFVCFLEIRAEGYDQVLHGDHRLICHHSLS